MLQAGEILDLMTLALLGGLTLLVVLLLALVTVDESRDDDKGVPDHGRPQ